MGAVYTVLLSIVVDKNFTFFAETVKMRKKNRMAGTLYR